MTADVVLFDVRYDQTGRGGYGHTVGAVGIGEECKLDAVLFMDTRRFVVVCRQMIADGRDRL